MNNKELYNFLYEHVGTSLNDENAQNILQTDADESYLRIPLEDFYKEMESFYKNHKRFHLKWLGIKYEKWNTDFELRSLSDYQEIASQPKNLGRICYHKMYKDYSNLISLNYYFDNTFTSVVPPHKRKSIQVQVPWFVHLCMYGPNFYYCKDERRKFLTLELFPYYKNGNDFGPQYYIGFNKQDYGGFYLVSSRDCYQNEPVLEDISDGYVSIKFIRKLQRFLLDFPNNIIGNPEEFRKKWGPK